MLANTFGAQLLTLPQIFDNNLFSIPDYQRGYAWDEKQVSELLRDISHLLDVIAGVFALIAAFYAYMYLPNVIGRSGEIYVLDTEKVLKSAIQSQVEKGKVAPEDTAKVIQQLKSIIAEYGSNGNIVLQKGAVVSMDEKYDITDDIAKKMGFSIKDDVAQNSVSPPINAPSVDSQKPNPTENNSDVSGETTLAVPNPPADSN